MEDDQRHAKLELDRLRGQKASIEVYARAARVELWLNGRIIGRKALKNDCFAKFSVTYEPGKLEAVSYDARGCELGRCTLTTAGQQTQITAGPEQSSVQAGHLCYIRLRYTDERGITKPLARGNIKVEVDGGTLVGLGNAARIMSAAIWTVWPTPTTARRWPSCVQGRGTA